MSEITRNPLCWPNNVPRSAPHSRGWPKFHDVSLNSAVTEVLAEINRLNGRYWDHKDENVILSSNAKLRLDGLPASNQPEPSDTGIAVYFKLDFTRNGKRFERPIVLTCDKWCKVSLNLKAIAYDIEAQRARHRWGCTSIEQAFQGYVAIPEKCGGAAWWVTLGIPSSAPRVDVEAAYKKLSKTAHPDVGGSHEQWLLIQEAFNQAMAQYR